ncbi:MAG: hypothetical protein ACHQ16_05590 [Candidatus Lutacidiplasmatales archaeon]
MATATVHPAALHTPPFHGTQHVASTVQKSGCGASASLVVLPKFNLTSGIGKESGKSAVTGCGPPGFSDTASTEATVGFDSLSVIAGSPAPGNFSFSSRFNVSWNLSATPGSPFGGPFAWASAALLLRVWLYDLTNATPVSGLTFIDSVPTTNGTTTGNVSGYSGAPPIFNGTFLGVTGHHYILQFYLEIWEWTYAPSGTSTHARASINAATGGHFMQLRSWSLY